MKNYPGYLPQSHRILWLLIRVALMLWGIYGIFHGSVVEFLEAIFAILFTHLWDYFQVFGGRSFIIRIGYENQTMLNVFMFVCVVIGSTLNNRTDFGSFDIVTHTCSGFISAWFGYDFAVLMQEKNYSKLSPALAAMFGLCFSLGIDVGWEIYEFTMDHLYGLSLQCSSPTTDYGLIDTMGDFICAASGALVGMFAVAFYRKKKRKSSKGSFSTNISKYAMITISDLTEVRRLKKAVILLITVLTATLAFSSCNKKSSVSVNGVPVSEGVYNYYYDIEKNSDEDKSQQEISDAALSDVAAYVAVNSEFKNRALSLSSEDKNEISQNVNNYWHVFSVYYNTIGVSKQDLQKIEESKKYKDAVMADYYSENGDEPVTDDELRSYFSENFIAFKAVTGYLPSGSDTDELEKQALLQNFTQYAGAVNDGASIDEVGAALENVNTDSDTVVIGKNDASYPDGFFDSVSAIEPGKTGAFIAGDYVYIVSREDVSGNDNLFSTYRIKCLKEFCGEEFDKKLSEISKAYKAVKK